MFPLLLLLLMLPIPFDLMDKSISVLQRGAAEGRDPRLTSKWMPNRVLRPAPC